jgi:hypothetical protein
MLGSLLPLVAVVAAPVTVIVVVAIRLARD